ncbi:aminotransferase class I/II-fold pyridoxal phosphate-dependent enzyme [Streptomyces chartreusis]|uniref:aminotransferase class I/II-fold pyridoxal phosphate-dependent enzyme n=1 Tax=Streptomyces chartreusis TaxID=1969 RepID=UPI0033BF9258
MSGAVTSPRAWPFYSVSARRRVDALVASGQVFVSGTNRPIEQFEDSFRRRHGDVEHAVMTNSGTSALLSAYFGLGLPAGSEVLVPTNTYRATVTPLLLLGLRPVLCNADPVTGNIDLDDASARITRNTTAIAVTHNWGRPVEMAAVTALARRHGLAVVEDCSHAHGAGCSAQPVGTFGDAAAFSLGNRKTVSGGTAGILLTKHRHVFERALLLGQPEGRGVRQVVDAELAPYVSSGFGANLRAHPVSAILAADHLDRLDETIRIKNDNLDQLAALLADRLPGLVPPRRGAEFTAGTWYGYQCAWHGGEATGVDRDGLVAALRLLGLPVSAPPPVLHHKPLFQGARVTGVPGRPGGRPADAAQYAVTDVMQSRLVSWDTRHLYEPAPATLERWASGLDAYATTRRK